MDNKKKIVKIASIALIFLFVFVIVGKLSSVSAQSPTATATASATPTASPSALPDAGISTPTFFSIAIGIIAIIFSLALAF